MKKILIFLALTSCELLKPEVLKKSDDNKEKPSVVIPPPTLSPEEIEKQEEQKKTNQLWMSNLTSQSNYSIDQSNNGVWNTTKIDIENGNFETTKNKFTLINAINESEANYYDVSNNIVKLEIRPLNQTDYQNASNQSFNDIDQYNEMVEGHFQHNFNDPVLYRKTN